MLSSFRWACTCSPTLLSPPLPRGGSWLFLIFSSTKPGKGLALASQRQSLGAVGRAGARGLRKIRTT